MSERNTSAKHAFWEQMPKLVFNIQDTKRVIPFLAAQKRKWQFPYLEDQTLYIINIMWGKGRERIFVFRNKLFFREAEHERCKWNELFQDPVCHQLHCLRAGILLQMKKRVAQQVLHGRSSISVLSGTSCHTLLL